MTTARSNAGIRAATDPTTLALAILSILSLALYLVRLDNVGGVPAHPLIVHVPVVLLPVAALGAAVVVWRTDWRQRYLPAVTIIAIVGMAGAVLAQGAGDALQEQIGGGDETVQDHAAAGTNVAIFAIAFVAFLLVLRVVEQVFSERLPRVGFVVLAFLTTAIAAVVLVGTIYAGHLGAKAAWEDRAHARGPETVMSHSR